MYSLNSTKPYTESYSVPIDKLRQKLNTADAIVVGAGAGLSASAGLCYWGSRFKSIFGDFEAAYGFHDMYSGSFYPYKSPEEFWAYFSRMIHCNRYTGPNDGYIKLLSLLKDKNYFIITTNVDHQFQLSGFQKQRIFYTQGDYGLFQCSEPCCAKTYDNEEQVRRMLEEQSHMKIPKKLIPHCPVCGKPMAMNLRADMSFVEDEGWNAAALRYKEFIERHSGENILFLELGVGYNTPGIIKYPFWRMTRQNPLASYACINLEEPKCPRFIDKQSLCIQADIIELLDCL